MKNKKLLILLILTFIIKTNSHAQEDTTGNNQENKFLFRSDKLDLSTFYFELSPVSLSKMNGQLENTSFLSGGFILNQKFVFGIYSESSPKLQKIEVPMEGTSKYQDWLDAGVEMDKLLSGTDSIFVTYFQSGLNFRYLHKPNNVVFWNTGVKLGLLGGVRLAEDQTFLGIFDNPVYKTNLVTITPEIGAGINLLKWWRVYADAGYRLLITNKSNNKVIVNENYNSMTFRFGFVFGNFNK